jgi:ABC-type uncharacterized transport system permease subunit
VTRRADWVSLALLPAINLTLALALSALVVLLAGENPARALGLLASGAFGNAEAVGYTLYYATNFVFTGLAVAVAFHAGLFNIGAEGQAYIGGLAVALLCLGAGGWPPVLVIPAAIVAAAAGGAAWAFGPGWLQARRGSHVVITTIMFNFIASALMTYLLVNVMMKPGQQSPETREFASTRRPGGSAGRSRARRSTSRPSSPSPPAPSSGSTSGTRAGATSSGSSVTTRRPPSTGASLPPAR